MYRSGHRLPDSHRQTRTQMDLPVASANLIGSGFSQSSKRPDASVPKSSADRRLLPIGAEPDSAIPIATSPSQIQVSPGAVRHIKVAKLPAWPDSVAGGFFQPLPNRLRTVSRSAGFPSRSQGCLQSSRLMVIQMQSDRVQNQPERTSTGFVPTPSGFSYNVEILWSLLPSTRSQNANSVIVGDGPVGAFVGGLGATAPAPSGGGAAAEAPAAEKKEEKKEEEESDDDMGFSLFD